MERSGEKMIEFRWTTYCDGGEELIGELLSGTLSDVGRRVVLLPTRRIVQQAKLGIALKGGGFTGPLITFNDLPRYLYDVLKGPQPVMETSVRDQIVRGIMQDIDLPSLSRKGDVRPGMVRSVSAALGELMSEGVSHRKLKEVARSRRSTDLAGIYKRYMMEIRERNIVDPDLLALGSVSLLRGSDLRLDSLGVYLPGRLPRSQLELLSLLMTRTDHVIMIEHASREPPEIPGIARVPPRPRPDPRVPLPGEKALSRLVSDRKIKAICGTDPMNETRSVFRDIKRRCLEEGLPPSSISMVLPSKRSRDDVVRAAALEYGVPVDQGEDLPLETVPIISDLMMLLGLPGNGFRRSEVVETLSSPFMMLESGDGTRLTGFDLELLTRLAGMGPTRRSPEEGWSRPLMELAGVAPDHVRELAIRFRPPLLELLEKLDAASRGRRTVKEHLETVSGIISYLRMEEMLEVVLGEGERTSKAVGGEGPFEMNRSAFRTFRSLLRSIERRSRVLSLGRTPFPEFLKSIGMEVSRSRVRSAPRSAGVQVMGLEEAAGLKLGTAYFMDLVEGSLPSVEGSFRFLSDPERLDLGLPASSDRRKELELLAITMGSTDEPVVSLHRNEGERPVLISSFIEDLSLDWTDTGSDPRSIVELHRRIGELNSTSISRDRREFLSLPHLLYNCGEDQDRIMRGMLSGRKRRCRESNEHSGRIMDPDLLAAIQDRYGRDHVWSVTQFETFRKCPYQFLVRYLFGLEELEDLEPGIPPEKRGLIFHEAAERFYERFRAEVAPRVTRENLDDAREVMRSITLEVMDRYPNRGPYWDALGDQLLGSDGEKGLMDCFLESEAGYTGQFLVHGTELRFGLREGTLSAVRISLPGEETGEEVFLLRGSIDRMDVLSTRHGEMDFIWDYKTGSSEVEKDSVQVPLYLAALRKLFPEHYPAGGGYYYVRRRGSIERVPVLGAGVWEGKVMDRDCLQAHIEDLEKELHSTVERCLEMIDSICAGDLSARSGCREKYCPFDNICRRRDA
ncbi:MAG: PD-(D/E)XK nuclease family protein [Candidatus Thermoplasmatota archaeon]|nr:PD-(D/E)XK nuclease family protein [Candidatus Thermoplasmatota archaeon]